MLGISLKKENPSAQSPVPSMSMSQRSIAASTTKRPYDSTSFRSHARSDSAIGFHALGFWIPFFLIQFERLAGVVL